MPITEVPPADGSSQRNLNGLNFALLLRAAAAECVPEFLLAEFILRRVDSELLNILIPLGENWGDTQDVSVRSSMGTVLAVTGFATAVSCSMMGAGWNSGLLTNVKGGHCEAADFFFLVFRGIFL